MGVSGQQCSCQTEVMTGGVKPSTFTHIKVGASFITNYLSRFLREESNASMDKAIFTVLQSEKRKAGLEKPKKRRT
jgi:hypothetical protein